MTLTQLSYCVAIARYGSFGQAAKKCHVTQPTLSMQVQKLEEDLGVLLFDRSKQPVMLTAIGHKLIEQAKTILREADRLTEIVKAESGLIQGEFRLGIIPTIAPYLLPLFLKRFLEKYPDVKLVVEELETFAIVAKLKDDAIDAGILATPLHDEGILEMKLYDEAFFVCFSQDDPLAQKTELLEKDLPLDRLLLLNEGNCLRDQMIHLCQFKSKKGREQRLQFESGSLHTLMGLVNQGTGFTILPQLAIPDPLLAGLSIRPFARPAPAREIGLAVHRSYIKHNILVALKGEILASLPKSIQAFQQEKSRLIGFQW